MIHLKLLLLGLVCLFDHLQLLELTFDFVELFLLTSCHLCVLLNHMFCFCKLAGHLDKVRTLMIQLLFQILGKIFLLLMCLHNFFVLGLEVREFLSERVSLLDEVFIPSTDCIVLGKFYPLCLELLTKILAIIDNLVQFILKQLHLHFVLVASL